MPAAPAVCPHASLRGCVELQMLTNSIQYWVRGKLSGLFESVDTKAAPSRRADNPKAARQPCRVLTARKRAQSESISRFLPAQLLAAASARQP